MAGPPLHPCHLRTGQDIKETYVHGKFAAVAEVRAVGSLELSAQPPARRERGGPGPGLCRRLSWAGRPDSLDSWTLAPRLLPPGLPGGGTLADDSDSSPGFSDKRDSTGHEVGAGLGISRGNSGSKSSLRGSLEKSPDFVEGVKGGGPGVRLPGRAGQSSPGWGLTSCAAPAWAPKGKPGCRVWIGRGQQDPWPSPPPQPLPGRWAVFAGPGAGERP